MSENNKQEMTLEEVKKIKDLDQLENIALTHPDYEVCAQAIKQIKNQNVLNKIALESKDINVRLNAVKYLKDSNDLAHIAKNDPDYEVREEALKNPNLKNQNALLEIYNNEYQRGLKKAALENPNFNETDLIDIARNDGYLAYETIYGNITERYANEKYSKYKIYTENKDDIISYYILDIDSSKIERIYLIKDEETLNLIESNRPYEEILNSKSDHELIELAKARYYSSYHYLKHVKDKTLLIDLMQDSTNQSLKLNIADIVSDESVILYYLDHEKYYFSRNINIHEDSSLEYLAFKTRRYLEDIISKITSQDILMNIALTHYTEEGRALAALNMDKNYASDYVSLKNYDAVKEKIMQKDDIKEILNEVPELGIRIALVKCSDNEEILEDIIADGIKPHFSSDFQKNIAKNRVSGIDDNGILIKLANSSNPNIMDEAIKKIKDEDMLVDIAKNDSELIKRLLAIRNPNLTSKSKLLEILEKEKNEDAQIEILEKICEIGD